MVDPEAADEAPVGARIDLHCHSAFSKDAIGSLDAIATAATLKRLDGVVLTEHDTLQHVDPVARWNEENADLGFRFYAGVEISARGGHILAYGVDALVPYGLPPAETVSRVQELGGVAVPAHPFRRGSGMGHAEMDKLRADLFAIEVWNAQEIRGGNKDAASWAVGHGIGGTGGSDAHQVHDVGNGYTEFPDPVDATRDLLDQLRSGDTWGVGGRTPMRTLLRQGVRNKVKRMRGEFVLHK